MNKTLKHYVIQEHLCLSHLRLFNGVFTTNTFDHMIICLDLLVSSAECFFSSTNSQITLLFAIS